jgi:alpha-acetolactate decarboxylase
MKKRHWLATLATLALGAGIAWAQPMGFQHHGNFTQMMRSGQAAGQVALSQLDSAPGVWGVGALADLRGEVIQVDGRVLVSLGSDAQGQVVPAGGRASATLWASARVSEWAQVPVPSNMGQSQFEAFVKEQAQMHKLDLEQPFVFRVTGDYSHLIWHVVTGDKPEGAAGGHSPQAHGSHGGGHANQQSGLKVFRYPQASGQLVGVYSGAQLEGVVSHAGERFHLHYIDDGMKISGHVDQFTVRAGSSLWVPLK